MPLRFSSSWLMLVEVGISRGDEVAITVGVGAEATTFTFSTFGGTEVGGIFSVGVFMQEEAGVPEDSVSSKET